jgi:hypothetical protein
MQDRRSMTILLPLGLARQPCVDSESLEPAIGLHGWRLLDIHVPDGVSEHSRCHSFMETPIPSIMAQLVERHNCSQLYIASIRFKFHFRRISRC